MNVFLDFDGPIVEIFDESANNRLVSKLNSVAKQLGYRELANHSIGFLDAWGELRRKATSDSRAIDLLDATLHTTIEDAEMDSLRGKQPDSIAKNILGCARSQCAFVAIVSNNSQAAINNWLIDNKLTKLVDFVIGRNPRNSFSDLKPNPKRLIELIRARKLCREVSLFVGDTTTDKVLASLVGIRFLGIRTRHSPDFVEADADTVGNDEWLGDRFMIPSFLEGAK